MRLAMAIGMKALKTTRRRARGFAVLHRTRTSQAAMKTLAPRRAAAVTTTRQAKSTRTRGERSPTSSWTPISAIDPTPPKRRGVPILPPLELVARSPEAARIFVGTSGWVYKGWRQHLYGDVPIKRWLETASRTFDSLEINGSFYTQISPATYARWHAETPAHFRFALKGHRFVTHYKRLRDCRDSIVRLRDQAAPLADKLAAVVWQLPARFTLDRARLDDFLGALRAWPTRHALELRHVSWFIPDVAARLRDAGVGVCLSDAPDFPMWREVTADFVYVRLHGHTRKYASSYSAASLRRWAQDALAWAADGRDVLFYLDNDAEGHAVRNARDLRVVIDNPALPFGSAASLGRAKLVDRTALPCGRAAGRAPSRAVPT